MGGGHLVWTGTGQRRSPDIVLLLQQLMTIYDKVCLVHFADRASTNSLQIFLADLASLYLQRMDTTIDTAVFIPFHTYLAIVPDIDASRLSGW